MHRYARRFAFDPGEALFRLFHGRFGHAPFGLDPGVIGGGFRQREFGGTVRAFAVFGLFGKGRARSLGVAYSGTAGGEFTGEPPQRPQRAQPPVGVVEQRGVGLAIDERIGIARPVIRPVHLQRRRHRLQRGIEREVIPAAEDLGVGIMAWSPLGRGVLTGKYRHGTPADSRAATSHFSAFITPYLNDRSRAIVDAVCTAAEGLGLTPIDVALAWTSARRQVSSAVIGARTAAQLRVVLNSVNAQLPPEIHEALDEVSAIERGYPDFGWNQ